LLVSKAIPAFCADLAQKRMTLIILLLFGQFAIFFKSLPQPAMPAIAKIAAHSSCYLDDATLRVDLSARQTAPDNECHCWEYCVL
jgi:hypothetical protein